MTKTKIVVREPAKNNENNVTYAPFERYLRYDIKILRIAGLYSMNSIFTNEAMKSTNGEAVAFGIGLMQLFFIASCEFRTVVNVWNDDPNYAINVSTVMFSGLLCAVKGLRLWFWRREFYILLRRFAVMWNNSDVRIEIRNENFKSADGTRFMAKCYITMVMTLVTSYVVRPYLLLLHHKWSNRLTNVSYDFSATVYPTSYPFPTGTMSTYIMCLNWELFVIVIGALYWMSSDTLFAQLTTHMAIQFRILRHDLEYIAMVDDDNERTNEKQIVHGLGTIAKRHHDLYMHCEMIERIYNPIIFLTMLLTGVNMCFCVFRFEKELSAGNWDEVIKYLFHSVTLLVQAVVYCGYADNLTQQSSLISEAAYDCQWIDRSKEFKILLQIIMMRSQKPFKCTAYGFFSVNLNQITAITNTAASYFALLKTMT